MITYRIEYDLDYIGGNYSSVGEFYTIMIGEDCQIPIPDVFEYLTGIDSVHIVHYCEIEEMS